MIHFFSVLKIATATRSYLLLDRVVELHGSGDLPRKVISKDFDKKSQNGRSWQADACFMSSANENF
jgi:hypothetical protein